MEKIAITMVFIIFVLVDWLAEKALRGSRRECKGSEGYVNIRARIVLAHLC